MAINAGIGAANRHVMIAFGRLMLGDHANAFGDRLKTGGGLIGYFG